MLKVIQELLSLTAFGVFSSAVLKEKLLWTDGLGFALILAGVAVAMAGRITTSSLSQPSPPPPAPGFQLLSVEGSGEAG